MVRTHVSRSHISPGIKVQHLSVRQLAVLKVGGLRSSREPASRKKRACQCKVSLIQQLAYLKENPLHGNFLLVTHSSSHSARSLVRRVSRTTWYSKRNSRRKISVHTR